MGILGKTIIYMENAVFKRFCKEIVISKRFRKEMRDFRHFKPFCPILRILIKVQ
nr:MAG TPA: hypothetical protein [Caudoviricetes sp.]